MADNAAPLIVLTRPQKQSERFAAQVADLAEVQIVPLQEIVPTGTIPDLRPFKALIFTSQNAAHVFGDRSEARDLPVWCVGSRTAEVARELGFETSIVGGNADRLVLDLKAKNPAAPILHLHGRHTRGNVAARLTAAGIPTQAAEIYAQKASHPDTPLGEFGAHRRVIAPLFSPRSAELLAAEIGNAPGDWHFLCLSDAVRDALPENLRPKASVAEDSSAVAMVCLVERYISP